MGAVLDSPWGVLRLISHLELSSLGGGRNTSQRNVLPPYPQAGGLHIKTQPGIKLPQKVAAQVEGM